MEKIIIDWLAVNDRRIRRHLSRVEGDLRPRDMSGFSEQIKIARQRNLDRLHEYRVRGEFPRNHTHPGRRVPCFIDRDGRVCAVAHLLIASGHGELASRVAATTNNAYVREMELLELDRWAEQAGLSVDELALIQPTYQDPAQVEFSKGSLELVRLAMAIGLAACTVNLINTVRGGKGLFFAILGMLVGAGLIYLGAAKRWIGVDNLIGGVLILNPFGEADLILGFVSVFLGLAVLLSRATSACRDSTAM